MKQKLSYMAVFCLLGLFVGYVLADVGGWQIHRPPTEKWFSGSTGDPGWNWMKAADKLIELGANPGTGKIWYVDSGVTTEGSGNSWESAYNTIQEAVTASDADSGDDRGDYFLIAQGHAETFTDEDLDITVSGATFIGLGNGSLAPTITYNHADAEVAIGVDNVTIRNIRFISSITGVLMGIEVEDGVDYFTIENCEFNVVAVGTDEFMETINFVNNNTGCTIRNNRFNSGAAGAATHAILCDADTAWLTIVGNDIRGDYSTAVIGTDTTASTDILIKDNILINGSLVADTGINTEPAIELLDATTGLIANNIFVSDVATALLMCVADDCVRANNIVMDTDGDEFSGSPEWAPYFVGADDANSIAGHVDG